LFTAFAEMAMSLTLQGIEARVRELALETVGRAGYQLVDLEYRREPGGWTLRLFIDKEGGVSLEDCQRVSHEVGTLLEVEDPIPHRFNLEVSSPGLDRALKSAADYRGAVGKLVRLVMRGMLDGRRNFQGRLMETGGTDDAMTLRLQLDTGETRELAVVDVDRARLIFEWPDKNPKRPTRKKTRSGRN